MMSHEGELYRQHVRLSLLRCLVKAADYSLNDSILCDMLRAVRFSVTRDQVRGELYWLAEQGLLRIETYDTITVAVLTERGQDVAIGTASHPGIKRPSAR
ncbi:MAG: ArsR family transcriptional regulator [Desulfobulbaceae bacterium]|nr:MAG: ArsR family transcriptional regulator [Desulfobulbaceae bacterium]